jgi:hypothetical protein
MEKNKIRNILRESLNDINEVRIPFNMNVPNDIVMISKIFRKNNYVCLIVGGAVRDSLLSKTIKDYDLVTDALPDKVIEMLKSQSFIKNILETGKSFGVINVITNSDEYEIATMREDVVILLVLITIVWAMVAIWPHAKVVSFAFVPYLIWVSIATALQLSITLKN